MAKTLVIEINEKDENVLLEILKKFRVKVRPLSIEDETIRENLRKKYVETGEWATMSLEDKEDAALYEHMMLVDHGETVDTDEFLKKLQSR